MACIAVFLFSVKGIGFAFQGGVRCLFFFHFLTKQENDVGADVAAPCVKANLSHPAAWRF